MADTTYADLENDFNAGDAVDNTDYSSGVTLDSGFGATTDIADVRSGDPNPGYWSDSDPASGDVTNPGYWSGSNTTGGDPYNALEGGHGTGAGLGIEPQFAAQPKDVQDAYLRYITASALDEGQRSGTGDMRGGADVLSFAQWLETGRPETSPPLEAPAGAQGGYDSEDGPEQEGQFSQGFPNAGAWPADPYRQPHDQFPQGYLDGGNAPQYVQFEQGYN